ncbi:MAG TPA: hypothetical protein V6D07_13370 [Trichocoleus sp.]
MNSLQPLNIGIYNTDNAASSLTSREGKTQRVKAVYFKFSYHFGTGQLLLGRVAGDVIVSLPNLVFNLHSLNAVLQDQSLQTVLHFDAIFGQFKLDQPEILLSGSDSASDSFFCFNYRAGEAIVFDGKQKSWIASGWVPEAWHVEASSFRKGSMLRASKRATQVSKHGLAAATQFPR